MPRYEQEFKERVVRKMMPPGAKSVAEVSRETGVSEAAKLAPRLHSQLAEVHEREVKKGDKNRATLAVARKLAAYMLAVDKRDTGFIAAEVTEVA